MAAKLVNLTLLKVIKEIQNILDICPTQAHQKLASNPNLQQQLIAYVLSRVPNRHVAIEEEYLSLISPHSICCSTLEQLEIENLVNEGVYYLMQSEKMTNLQPTYKDMNFICLAPQGFN
jgi:hypothetical protein